MKRLRLSTRSVDRGGRRIIIRLEAAYWQSLEEIAQSRGELVSSLLQVICSDQEPSHFASAIRIYILNHYIRQRQQIARPSGEAPEAFRH